MPLVLRFLQDVEKMILHSVLSPGLICAALNTLRSIPLRLNDVREMYQNEGISNCVLKTCFQRRRKDNHMHMIILCVFAGRESSDAATPSGRRKSCS